MKPSELKKNLKVLVRENINCLIKGAPGIGKSDIVSQVASELGYDLIIFHPVVSEPTDFKGLPAKVAEDKATFLPYGELYKLIEAKKPTLCFFDDLGQASTSVQAAVMQLVLVRRINGHKISDQVRFVAATNRKEDRAAVTSLLDPLKTRFVILELNPEVDDWVRWAIDNKICPEVIAWVKRRPEVLSMGSDKNSQAKMTNFPTPRTIAMVSKLIEYGLDDVECLAGCIGEGAAAELKAFLQINEKLPSIEEILEAPTVIPVPKEIDVLYALAMNIVYHISKTNADKLLKFALRLPADFQILIIKLSHQKDKTLIAQCKEFRQWIEHNKDLIL